MLTSKMTTVLEQLKSQEIYRCTFDLSEIKLVSMKEIEIKDRIFKISSPVFEELMKLIGLKKEDWKKDKKQENHNETQTVQLLNHLRKCLALLGKKLVSVSINKKGEIVHVSKDNCEDLNFSFAASVAEDILNALPVKDLSKSLITPDGFLISFTENKEFDIKGFKDEFYRVGKTIEFKQSGGFTVQSYVERMICTNGMYGFVYGEKAQMLESKQLKGLIGKVQSFNHENFVHQFQEGIYSHANQVMSSRELNQMERFVNKTLNLEKNERVQLFLDTKPVSKVLNKQLKGRPKELQAFMRTPFNSWEMINKLTYIGSHTSEFDIHEASGFALNRFASNMLTEIPDIEMMRLPKQIF